MTSDNLNIVLTNSLCCISAQAVKVSKLYSIGDKCADSELQKLKLMNDWFNIIKCHNFNTVIYSKFLSQVTYDEYLILDTTISDSDYYYCYEINGIPHQLQGDNVTSIFEILSTILTSSSHIINVNISIDPDKDYDIRLVNVFINANCEITSIIYKMIRVSDSEIINEIPLLNYTPGQCTVTNCLTENQINNIINKLMAACDICKCQLK